MEPVGLGVQVQKPFAALGDVVNMGATIQNMQRGNVALQTEQMVLGERQKIEQYLRNPSNYMDDKGSVNYPKLIREMNTLAPTTGADYISRLIKTDHDRIVARDAYNKMNAEERRLVAQEANSLINQPAAVVEQQLNARAETNPNLKPITQFVLDYYVRPNASDQKALNLALSRLGGGSQSITEQQTAMRGQYANTGGELKQIDPTAKMMGMAPSVLPMTLPPGEREQVGTHPVTQEYVTTRKDQEGRVTGVTQTPQAPEVMRPKPGEGAAIQHTAQTVGKDFATTLEEGQNAGRAISALQEIRKYAPGAVTGVAQEKRQFAQKLFSWLGLDYSEEAAAKTDLLAKNSNMLSAAGGNTDLARVLAEGANPNVKMEPKAILRAVDQVLGQQQLKLARAAYLQQFTRDPTAYAQAVTEFNRVADPRVFEYPNWSQEEKQAQKANMNPAERKAFGDALRFFQSKGYIR